ncbi:MAG: SPOR domain-containing protein [Bernardetiaceae bacterium]|nr:SPOR domain-containing protein [Bernardetiaceae bacterium]
MTQSHLFNVQFASILCLLLFSFAKVNAQKVPEDLCLIQDEMQLYQAIDDLRNTFQQHQIPISKALTYTAKMHARDLANHYKQNDDCTVHSWSDQGDGKWTACCHTTKPEDANCMWKKAKEVSGYAGEAYEIVYYGKKRVRQVVNEWKKGGNELDILANKGDWKDFDWTAIGLAVYEDWVVIWVGEKKDPLPSPSYCADDLENWAKADLSHLDNKDKTTTTQEQKSNEQPTEETVVIKEETPKPSNNNNNNNNNTNTGSFHIIYGSYGSDNYANSALSDVQNAGFADARILPSSESGRLRIALESYNTKQEAKNALDRILNTYPNAWVLSE